MFWFLRSAIGIIAFWLLVCRELLLRSFLLFSLKNWGLFRCTASGYCTPCIMVVFVPFWFLGIYVKYRHLYVITVTVLFSLVFGGYFGFSAESFRS